MTCTCNGVICTIGCAGGCVIGCGIACGATGGWTFGVGAFYITGLSTIAAAGGALTNGVVNCE